jgi:hypothetical protein
MAPMQDASLVGLSGTDGLAEAATDIGPAHAVLALIYVTATAAGAYHGYKRNDSVGWAIGWGLAAGIFPYIALPIAAAQGFGERARD